MALELTIYGKLIEFITNGNEAFGDFKTGIHLCLASFLNLIS